MTKRTRYTFTQNRRNAQKTPAFKTRVCTPTPSKTRGLHRIPTTSKAWGLVVQGLGLGGRSCSLLRTQVRIGPQEPWSSPKTLQPTRTPRCPKGVSLSKVERRLQVFYNMSEISGGPKLRIWPINSYPCSSHFLIQLSPDRSNRSSVS